MERSSEKERRKPRDERETKHRHNNHRENDDDDDHRSSSSRRSRREKSRERSEERESRREREVEKRKVRDESDEEEDDDRKRSKVSGESRRERRRFDGGEGGAERKERKRRFEDVGERSSRFNDGNVESLSLPTRPASETIPSDNHSASKVSSLSTTSENKGINVTGSHEVNGKSSTNGTSTTAGKSGAPSLDALALAKKTLQKQKELREKLEKLKKMPMSNKGAGASSVVSSQVGTIGGKGTGGTTAIGEKPIGTIDPEKYEAVKRAQELAAKMGFRQDPEFAPLINLFPGQLPPDVSVVQKPAKAPVLRLDALGREIDEHGNVVNISKPSSLSTLKVNINKQKKDAFQIEKPELEVDPEKNPHFDPRMGIDKNKLLRPKRQNFLFVEEGKWSKDAEMIKLKSQFGEAQAKELKAKQAQLAKAKAEPNINPNLIEVSERIVTKEKKQKDPIPEVEWWDVPLLRSGNYMELDDGEPLEDKLKMDKITIYVEHPEPIEPPLEAPPPPPQPLKLTKKEQKKLRTQRRLAAEKDKQEMIRQGLIEPPKPKVKMSNLMRVLGSEATQDPTRLEKQIRAAAAEREQAHVDRNIARKLTPAERREKKERKLFDDPNTLETIVSVYKINNLSHPQNRFKVDVNAQENRLTGCAVLQDDFSVVVVEGGMKSIKRYAKLMLRRINWDAKLEKEDEEEDNEEEKQPNKCVLVWQGSVAKPSFNRFFLHDCRNEAAARKVFADAGVGHYWDLAANFVDDQD
ncbi:hypothetical protein vseg_005869 [Gypsophila vaccaria]